MTIPPVPIYASHFQRGVEPRTSRSILINSRMRLFEIEQKRDLHGEIVSATDPRVVIRQMYREYILGHTRYQPPKGLSEDEIVDKIYNYYFSDYQPNTDLNPKYMYRITGVDEAGQGEEHFWASTFYPILTPEGHHESKTFGHKSMMNDNELLAWRGWRSVVNDADEASGGNIEMLVRALFAIQHDPELNFEFYRELQNAVHQMDISLHDGIIRGEAEAIIPADEYYKAVERMPQMLRKVVSNSWKQGRVPQKESARLIEIIDDAWNGLKQWIDAPYVKIEKVGF